jgi:hypothetical protein
MEETVRVAATAGIIVRRVAVDTEVLGYRVPKGSNLILNTRLTVPHYGVPEERRSATSRVAQERRTRGGLDGESGRDLAKFEPRRWLVTDDSGNEVFDPNELPANVFGGGFRGCFGEFVLLAISPGDKECSFQIADVYNHYRENFGLSRAPHHDCHVHPHP